MLDAKFFVRQASCRYPDPSLPICEVLMKRDGALELVKIPVVSFAKECDAITTLARIDGETVREKRYIVIYSAYEALVRQRIVLHGAIRHSFAHATTSLTRENVRHALIENLGGLRLNFRSHEHLKVYYRCLVEMLVAIDQALKETFEVRRSELVCLPAPAALLKHATEGTV